MASTTPGTTDDESLALIIQLLQEDRAEAVAAGTLTDTDMALDLVLGDMQENATFTTDQRMAKSIQSAIQLDCDALAQSQTEAQTHDEDLIERLERIYVTGGEDADSNDDQSENLSELRHERPCDSCTESTPIEKLLIAPCRHQYYGQCICQWFQESMADESIFPPQCCQEPIPLDQSERFLDPEVARQFPRKAIEFATTNRIYCHNTECVAFIPPTSYSDTAATCVDCSHTTCITCKKESHDGDCPEDENLQQVIQLARQEGWQRCPTCFNMIELTTGCYHISCPCGFEFCYLCAACWKTCNCVQWDENRLLDRAAVIEARAHPEPNQDRQHRVQMIAQRLRQDHECHHEMMYWIRREGRRRCELCREMMPLFILECPECHTMACWPCKQQRIERRWPRAVLN